MSQKRDLRPVTVYLPPEVLRELEQQARRDYSNVSAVVRGIVTGHVRDQLRGQGDAVPAPSDLSA